LQPTALDPAGAVRPSARFRAHAKKTFGRRMIAFSKRSPAVPKV